MQTSVKEEIMDTYKLKADESVLYKGDVRVEGVKGNATLQLTNYNIVLNISTKKNLFSKAETSIQVYPVDAIKIYNEKPQIKVKGYKVEIYFEKEEIILNFYSKMNASKFNLKATELITGKNIPTRGVDKIKNTLDMVDDKLGLDVVGVAKGIAGNGIIGTVLGGINNNDAAEDDNKKSTELSKDSDEKNSTEMPIEDQIEAIKKLKELLDIEAITKEEFEAKKKQIMQN